MRTSGGHCAQCDPSKLAFQERYRSEAYVYIAGSQDQRILKVGYSDNPTWRIDHLSAIRYGAATDWLLLYYVRCKRAGAIEHTLLARHRADSVFREYWKDRKYQECFELLRCDYSELRNDLFEILGEAEMQNVWERRTLTTEYNFGTKDE